MVAHGKTLTTIYVAERAYERRVSSAETTEKVYTKAISL
jgi:hypothetical protein